MPRNAVQPLDKFFNVMSLVAIVGRPNVGKSTLFNRLVGQRQAIVDSTAGTTRDRHYGKTDWNGKEFSIIDTGGYTVNSEDIFEDEIRRQVLLAIDEADVILFLVEVATGITDLDMLMADILRRTSKKVILVCNKVDNNDQIYSSHEFYALGLGDPYCISSMSGSGTGDLMDAILDALPVETTSEEDEDLPHITIVGRPNVGKSSLTNALLGEERNLLKFTEQTAGELADSARSMWEDFTLPATPESTHLLDRAFFGRMRPGSYLVNTARGAVIDDAALCEAIRSGRLAGAALDAYDPEPVTAEHPLVRLAAECPDRLILCPHQGGISHAAFREAARMVFADLEKLMDGKRPERVVNGL